MSGLTQQNLAGVSGLVAQRVHFQRITSTATDAWTKPDGVSIVWLEAIGAGGGGSGGGGSNSARSGAGGGGGAYAWACFSAAALPSALDVVIGAGGTNGDGGAGSGAGTSGTAGGATDVNIPSGETDENKIILRAFGGGAGFKGEDGKKPGGGGGGGTGSVGLIGSENTGGFGGDPTV